jgi:hypothetical protein
LIEWNFHFQFDRFDTFHGIDDFHFRVFQYVLINKFGPYQSIVDTEKNDKIKDFLMKNILLVLLMCQIELLINDFHQVIYLK